MSVGKEFREVEKPVVEWAEKNKWLTLKINVLGKRGWPDHFFFGRNRVLVMIEFKAPGHKPGKLQAFVHSWLKALQWPVYTVTSKEQGIDILKREAELGAQAVPRKSA